MLLLTSYDLQTYVHSTLVNNVDELLTLLQKKTCYISYEYPRVLAKKRKNNIYVLYLDGTGTYTELEINGQFDGIVNNPKIPWFGNERQLNENTIKNGDYIILVDKDGRKRNKIRFQNIINQIYGLD